MPMIAYFVAKDLAAYIEATASHQHFSGEMLSLTG